MNHFSKRLAAFAVAAAALASAAPAGAETVTVFHDKPFYQAGWDG